MNEKTNADLALSDPAEDVSSTESTWAETVFIGGPVRKSQDEDDKKRPQERTKSVPQRQSQPPMTLEQAEAVLVRQALAKHQGNQRRAADQLGLSLEDLRDKMKRFGL